MPSNFKSTGKDLDDLFIQRSDTIFSQYYPAGTLWSWGNNGYGQLGLNDRNHRSSPIQVGTLTNWKKIDGKGGNSTAAIAYDGGLWTWGINTSGQLGSNNRTHRSSPAQVGSLTDWKEVSCGYEAVLAVKTDGTLWSWGNNGYGQLGSGTRANRSSPVQVGALTIWNKVAIGSTGASAAIDKSGRLWTWGHNYFGQLGSGTNGLANFRSSPVQVGALTDWKEVSVGQGHMVAIRNDYTLWTWGQNLSGELGSGTTTPRSSPGQVGALTNWKQISAGGISTVAVKTDGTLWAWGSNGSAQLGLGNTTGRSSPTQVGTLTNWKKADTIGVQTIAIKTDGTLWGWGGGNYGISGLNNNVWYQSPVQIGALTGWSDVTAGANYYDLAIRNLY